MGEVEEEDEEEEEGGNVDQEQEGELDAAPERGNENSNEGRVTNDKYPPLRFQKYKEAVRKFCLHHTDNDLVRHDDYHQNV